MVFKAFFSRRSRDSSFFVQVMGGAGRSISNEFSNFFCVDPDGSLLLFVLCFKVDLFDVRFKIEHFVLNVYVKKPMF